MPWTMSWHLLGRWQRVPGPPPRALSQPLSPCVLSLCLSCSLGHTVKACLCVVLIKEGFLEEAELEPHRFLGLGWG